MVSDNSKKTVIVIPARYESTRLPGKLLKDLGGKTVIERVYEQAKKSKLADEVVIATDNEKILEAVQGFDANVEMTRADHQSGTDRIAELAHNHSDWSVIINVQGDEPFINPDDIDKAIEPFRYDPTIKMTSLYHEMTEMSEVENPNNVKVVVDINDEALYFSRSVIPHKRADGIEPTYKKHIGLYGYTRETLLALSHLEPTELEKTEKLEQLRALENEIRIKMVCVESAPLGIDTEADLEAAKKQLSALT